MNDSKPASAHQPETDLSNRRSQIRQGLKRANLAAVIILLVVIGLSLGAVLQAFRAERNSQEAQRSRRAAERELEAEAIALMQQARAERRSGESNLRSESLEALSRAAALRTSPALLDEAIAVLALPALQFVPVWTNPVPTFFQFTPDFGHFGFRTRSGEIRLLTTDGTTNDITLPSVGSPVDSFWFSADGQFVAVGYLNGSNIVWNLSTRNPVLKWGREWRFHAFSSDSACVIVLDGLVTLRCLALADGHELWHCQSVSNRVGTLACSSRGHYFALADVTDAAVQVRKLDTGELVRELPGRGPVASLAWSLDGQRIVIGRANGWLDIWDAGTWVQVSSWRAHDDAVVETRFDPLGRWLVSASWDRTIRLWSLSDFRLEMTALGYDGHMVARFSPDGARLACARAQILGYLETSPSPILRWLLVPPADVRGTWSLDISPDGKLVAAGYEDGLCFLDLDTGRQLAFEPINDCRSALFMPDGKGIVTSGQTGLAYWPLDCSTVATNGSITLGPRQAIDDRPFVSATLTSDGRWVLAANRVAGLLEMFEVHHPTNHVRLGSHYNAQFVAVSPDGQWLASGTWFGRGVKIWNIARQRLEKDLPSEQFAGVAFSPDSRMLVTSERGYRFWECGGSWRECYSSIPDVGAIGPPCAFSPDGRLLALMKGPHAIELCDRPSGRVMATLQAPGLSGITGLRFTTDSTRLVALEWARQIQVWELPRMRQELGKLGLNLDNSGSASVLVALGTNGLSVPTGTAAIPSDSGTAAEPGPRMFGIQMGTWFYILPLTALALGVAIAFYTLRYHQRMMHSYEDLESLATERNQALHAAQAELLHSQKMRALGTLAAGIAHDFNNLLSVIRMGNNFLRRRDISSEEKAESGQAVERAVDQGKQIVRSMLGYSREPSEEESYSVLDLVNEAGLLLNQQFLRGITVTLELNRELPLVLGRRARLQQILLNLMVNASEAMNGQGRLRIAAQLTNSAEGEFVLRPGRAARYIELVIEDTGPGINPKIQDRIFEPFFSTKPRGTSSGTGLGLSLVHSLAEQEKLGIRLESAPGRGTLFTLWIPVLDGSEETLRQSKSANQVPA